jgi:hypothetical protein
LDTDDHRVDAGQGHARHREERRDERAARKKDGKAPTEISLGSVHDHLRLADALDGSRFRVDGWNKHAGRAST